MIMGRLALVALLGLAACDSAFIDPAYRSTAGADAAGAYARLLPLAEDGHAEAQFTLASMLLAGRGPAADPAAAALWLRRAADQGDVDAQFALARLYRDGIGVVRDQVESEKWLARGQGKI
ncbi:MAG: sel1 repeat family protein [Alphaproteobacteria bacterium]|nr:sel1 repeat family protein [Alphaproteobacteria bacterium]